MSRARKWTRIAGAALLWPGLAAALGLGELETRSSLNQPFEGRIPIVRAEPQELATLSVELADPEAHARAMLTPSGVAGGLRFEVVRDGARPYVRVMTDQPIRDPFFTVLIEFNWAGGQALREYTTLLDPPVLTQQAPTVTRAPTTREAPTPAVPAARAPAPAQPAAAPERQPDYGPVREGENLWEISRRVSQGSGASLNQVMLAIYRRNPQAFAGNVNLLRQGVVLDLPPADEIRVIPRQEAISAIAQMNDAWRQRGAPAAQTASLPADSGNTGEAASPASPAAAEPAADAPRRPRLQLVAPDEALDGAMAADEGQAAGQGGEMAASTAAEDTLRGELVQLQEDLQESQALLRLRNAELASLQRRLAELESGAAAGSEAVKPEPDAAAAPAEPTDGAETDTAAPSVGPAAADSATPTGEKASSWLRDPLWLLLAAGGILLVLLLLILRRRRTPALGEHDALDDLEQDDASLAGPGEVERVELEDETAGVAPIPDAADEQLAEIDLALAQGQTDEALDLVERALGASPSTAPVALQLKHAEVLAAAGLHVALDEELDRLEADPAARTHPDWPAVAALRPQAGADLDADPDADLTPADPAAPLDLNLDENHREIGADEEAAAQDEPLEFEQLVEDAADRPAAAAAMPPDEQAEALESKLDLARAYLEMEAYDEARAALDAVAAQGSELQRQEADTLRLQLPAAESGAAAAPRVASDDEVESSVDGVSAGTDEADAAELAADEPSWLSEEESAVETKLDLARAYIGMEDLDGARGLLRDVLDEGSDDQQAQAQRMLEELP